MTLNEASTSATVNCLKIEPTRRALDATVLVEDTLFLLSDERWVTFTETVRPCQ